MKKGASKKLASKKPGTHRLPASLPETDLRRYDWSRARRGTYARRAKKVSGLMRILDDDLAKDFPDSRAVNDALRALKGILAIRIGRAA